MGAELCQLGHPRKSIFIDLVPEVDGALAAGRQGDQQGKEVDRKIRPGGRLDLWQEVRGEGHLDDLGLPALDPGGGPVVGHGHAQLGERPRDQVEVLRHRVAHADLPAGDRAEGEEGGHLVVVRPDGDRGAVEAAHALDGEHAGADPPDLGAHRHQGLAEVLHMRLACRVYQGGGSGGDAGSHGKVLCHRDRHVVEPIPGPPEAVQRRDRQGITRVYGRSQRRQDVQVGIDLAHAERAALRVGAYRDPAHPAQQGRVEEHGRAHVLRQLRVGQRAPEGAVVHAHDPRLPIPLDPGTLGLEEGHELVQVGDVGDVGEGDTLVRQQCRAQDGQHGILVARRRYGAGEGLSSVNDKISHGK
jgi:hypothetical protein